MKGIGIVAITGTTGIKLISDALLAPIIHPNLLSIGQSLEKVHFSCLRIKYA